MTSTEIAAANKIILGTTEADAMYIGSTLIWQKSGGGSQVHDYSLDYFTIESLQDGNKISATKNSSNKNPEIYYSLDNGTTWSSQTLSSGTITFGTIDTGEKIIFKSSQSQWASAWNQYNRFNASKNFKVYGNVMSLVNGSNFTTDSSFLSNSTHNLAGLFYGTTTLVDASDLILPATTLYPSSYNGMFRGCTNLVNGPKLLPALDIPTDAYSSMFEGCVNLVEGPEIMAITASGNTALNRMFCMSRSSKVTCAMTKSPIIRITNPSSYNNVFQQLFAGNGNINEVIILAQGTNLSFANWLANTSSGGVIKKPSATTLTSGGNGVPSGWTTVDYTQS